jgi:hypothetical protein
MLQRTFPADFIAPCLPTKTTVLDARTLSRVEMPNRDGFIPDPRPDRFK